MPAAKLVGKRIEVASVEAEWNSGMSCVVGQAEPRERVDGLRTIGVVVLGVSSGRRLWGDPSTHRHLAVRIAGAMRFVEARLRRDLSQTVSGVRAV
jgi:hypothetical protein